MMTADTPATTRSVPVRDQSYPTIWWHVGCGYCESKFGGPFTMTDEEATAAFNAARMRAREHVRTTHGDGKRVRAAMRGEIKRSDELSDADATEAAAAAGAIIPEGELHAAIEQAENINDG
jgi:hypothetical protein